MEQRQRVKVERGRKRVRAYLGGEVIADTRNPLLVWEVPYYPMYYFPLDDVHLERLTQTDETTHAPSRGDARLFDVRGGRGVVRARAAARYDDTPVEELRGTVRLDWDAMDNWVEEDEPVHVHPHDPYKRIDILGSSRRVRIEVEGVVLAESTQPRILFETTLPPRYYLPLTDVASRTAAAVGNRDRLRVQGPREPLVVPGRRRARGSRRRVDLLGAPGRGGQDHGPRVLLRRAGRCVHRR